MKKILAVTTLILISLSGFCQNKTFTMTINSDNTKFVLTYCGLNTNSNYNPDTSFTIVPNKENSFSKFIHTPGFYQIMDGFKGHLIFIEPGDTINIDLKKKDSLYLNQENKDVKGASLRRLIATSKRNGNIMFFDANYNMVGYRMKPELFENPQDFAKRVLEKFNKSLNLLKQYEEKGLITAAFKKFATTYLEVQYVSDFTEMLSTNKKETINKNCFSFIDKLSFKDSLSNDVVPNYSAIAYAYVLFINFDTAPAGDKDKHFKNLNEVYPFIIKNYSGIQRDQMLAWSIGTYASFNDTSFGSFYNAFLSDCKNEKIRLSTISKVAEINKKIESDKVNKMTLPQIDYSKVLSDTYLKTINGEKVKLQDILSDKIPTLIDCWASWCGPCIANIPTVKQVENKYKGKLNVVYLSLDNDELKWSNYLKSNPSNSKNEYIVESNFASLFANYFNIKSIPRYILLKNKGLKIIDNDMVLNYSIDIIQKALSNNAN